MQAGEPMDVSDENEWDWSGRGRSHVEFSVEESIPLTRTRSLGSGATGHVSEAAFSNCAGRVVALKRLRIERAIRAEDINEIEIMKRTSHTHIVRLIGFYTQGRVLGLLLHPVAICDLAAVLHDMDHSLAPSDQSDLGKTLTDSKRIELFGTAHPRANSEYSQFCLGSLGCIARALEYLHLQGIKHKDIKPANILLGRPSPQKQLWLADFGISTDISERTTSATEDGKRGTARYFAPEVALVYGRVVRRSGDIFSLGCVFFEMLALCSRHTLQEQKNIRKNADHSFQANIDNIVQWFNDATLDLTCAYLMTEVRRMLRDTPESRPSATDVARTIGILLPFVPSTTVCCRPEVPRLSATNSRPILAALIYGNTYEGFVLRKDKQKHSWCLFVQQRHGDFIDKVIFFLDPTYCDPQRVVAEHPFKIHDDSWGSHLVKAAVFFKQLTYWRTNFRESYRHWSEPIVIERSLQLHDSVTSDSTPLQIRQEVV